MPRLPIGRGTIKGDVVRHGTSPNDGASETTTIRVWALIWTIFVAKLATLVLVVWAAHSFEAAALVSATTWPWLVVASVLAVGPLLLRYRLRRVRARRQQLLRADWMVDAAPAWSRDHASTRRRA